MASLRGAQQPELSKKLFKIIKSENHAIGAYEAAARERQGIAQQLSEWGEATGDETISEISDKLGVLLAEIAEQEDIYAQGLEEYRGVLKQIRNTESSVQPSRDHKTKVCYELGATQDHANNRYRCRMRSPNSNTKNLKVLKSFSLNRSLSALKPKVSWPRRNSATL
jgi:hypothetical protein